MIVLKASFILLMILSAIYSVMIGGKTARITCLMMIVAAFVTQAVTLNHNVRWPLFAVDVILLAGLMFVALRSNRFWPLWTTGLQSAGVAAHIAVFLSRHIDQNIYHAVMGIWSLPIFLVMPIGIFLDQRAEQHNDAERSRRSRKNRSDDQ
ncbi:hypothetical protein [Sphingobium sp. YR768]|jgi:hypothetical protein|uniref:hypothetical protein n=1 Tax=Sphingobium sp. YR768 TaxID=1884365 RepID=UPI0008ACEB05|nr:hypothetical protein [Sphingobium sp. YR768]SES13482.1 hypothetical protein SAMN05518866_1438 [Sphingobium sp. YR768]